ncbi:hypothetical protein RFI_16928, partial [Reticulomyxa filosa]
KKNRRKRKRRRRALETWIELHDNRLSKLTERRALQKHLEQKKWHVYHGFPFVLAEIEWQVSSRHAHRFDGSIFTSDLVQVLACDIHRGFILSFIQHCGIYVGYFDSKSSVERKGSESHSRKGICMPLLEFEECQNNKYLVECKYITHHNNPRIIVALFDIKAQLLEIIHLKINQQDFFINCIFQNAQLEQFTTV